MSALLLGLAVIFASCTSTSAPSPTPPATAAAATAIPTTRPTAAPTAIPTVAKADPAAASQKLLASIPDKYWTIGAVGDVKDAKASGALLVDVREPSEYAAGHIPGAVNIPFKSIASDLDKIPYDKPVILYCASTYRAGIATAALQMLGYANARDFTGKLSGWQAANEPVSKDATAATTLGMTKADATLVSAVDAWLKAIPEGNYGIGTIAALKDAQSSGLVLVDVREPSEYAAGHIPGAINVPIRDLGKDPVKLPKDKAIAVYCSANHRAGMSVIAMRLMGYTNVRAFTMNYTGWTGAGEQIEK